MLLPEVACRNTAIKNFSTVKNTLILARAFTVHIQKPVKVLLSDGNSGHGFGVSLSQTDTCPHHFPHPLLSYKFLCRKGRLLFHSIKILYATLPSIGANSA
jgi:hypothetical protein